MKGLLLPCLAASQAWRRRWGRQRPEPPPACQWCEALPRVEAMAPAASLGGWRGVAPACAWCAFVEQKHAYCQGFGGRFCADGLEKCSVPARELDRHCALAYTNGAVQKGACAARCAHAAASAPRDCIPAWVAANPKAARHAARACQQTVDEFFHGTNSDTLAMLVHLQKTGGWSVVDAARAANVRCPDVIANAKVEKRRAWFNATYLKAEHRDGCAGYRASTPQDEGLLRSSILGQQAVLAAHHRMFGLLHVEQPLSRVWPAFLGTKQVFYVTVLRDPLQRALSHFRMATREVDIPGIYAGLPFGRAVGLQEFADQPLRDCVLCVRRGRASDRAGGYFGVASNRNASTLVGGGEFRHCCRKQWRYAADNYYARELGGFASLAELPFGGVNATHGEEASRRLDAFDAVLITEQLGDARPVLSAKLGWCLPRDFEVPWRNRGSPESDGEYPAAALAALEARNAVDRAVYERAVRAFEAVLRRRARRRGGRGGVL